MLSILQGDRVRVISALSKMPGLWVVKSECEWPPYQYQEVPEVTGFSSKKEKA